MPSSPASDPTPPRYRLLLVLLLLAFGLLAWGIWWYFEYKIQSLAVPH